MVSAAQLYALMALDICARARIAYQDVKKTGAMRATCHRPQPIP